MQASESQRNGQCQPKRTRHAGSFAKVRDGRKQPIRGLWIRNGRFYARLSVEADDGNKVLKWVSLLNPEGIAVETVPQATAEISRLRTQRADNKLPVLGRTPIFSDYSDNYLKQLKAGQVKKAATIAKEEAVLKKWKKHFGGIQLDKIRPAMVVSFLNRRLAAGVDKRTAHLDIIILRNVLKQARDVDELVHDLPLPPGLNKKLKTVAQKRELLTTEELESLCKAALSNSEDGTPVTKNRVQFCDYVRLMAYSGARRNEALALRWADVDFDAEKLTIERQAGGPKGKDQTTKNGLSRTVDFTPALKNLLLEMKSRRAPDSQWLFPSPQRGGKDVHAKSFRESLELSRRHAKLRRVGFHDLRHHFVSYCVMSGIDFMTIARWAGHKDGGILIGNVYGHLASTHTKLQARRVNFEPKAL